MENQAPTITIDLSEIDNESFSSQVEGEKFLKQWAMKKGFQLSKTTSSKNYVIYLKCHYAGKSRQNPNLLGKRTKKSKKTGS